MSLCRLMVMDFLGAVPEPGSYDDYDVRAGKAYAEELITQGFRTEPFYEFGLEQFVGWCNEKL